MILKMLKPMSLFWDDEGHFGAGLYYAGVCCCESLEELKAYFNTAVLGTDALKDSCIFVLTAIERLTPCNDGEVVNPTEIIEVLQIEVLQRGIIKVPLTQADRQKAHTNSLMQRRKQQQERRERSEKDRLTLGCLKAIGAQTTRCQIPNHLE